MIYKKLLCGIGILTICFMLTGCCMSHEWKEATCTEPKICTKCGETEGEALGHTWVEATCAEPKTCSVCGETEAEPLEHTLTEANYQQPATCEVCGETVGEPLQADFEKYGLVCNAKLYTPITFKVRDFDTSELTATAEAVFSDYEVFESDDKHQALNGYEWRAVTATVISQNGAVTLTSSDYYNVAVDDTYDESNGTFAFTVNYSGIDYTECQLDSEVIQNEWNGDAVTLQARIFFRVPIGYDGCIVYFFTRGNEENGDYINDRADENAVIFRLQ